MHQSISPKSVAQAEIALKRIKRLCGGVESLFEPIKQVAITLAQSKSPVPFSKQKTKPDYRSIVAAVFGADLFNNIQHLKDGELDEVLSTQDFVRRRQLQSERLAQFLSETATAYALHLPEDLAALATKVIRQWQPTAKTPERDVDLAKEIEANLREHFAWADLFMHIAAHGGHLPDFHEVQRLCALLPLLMAQPFIGRNLMAREILLCNVGEVATFMGNDQDEVKRQGALALFETLHLQGDPVPGLHLAKMRFYGWGTLGVGKDVGHSNNVIDTVFRQFREHDPLEPPLFLTRTGLKEMLDLRIQIKRDLIINGKSDPAKQEERIKELIDTLMVGLEDEFDYGFDLAELLAPFEFRPNPIRDIIAAIPRLQEYCRNLHNAITEDARAAGLDIPAAPNARA